MEFKQKMYNLSIYLKKIKQLYIQLNISVVLTLIHLFNCQQPLTEKQTKKVAMSAALSQPQ